MEYNFHEHVASDIGIGQQFLPAENYPVQENLNEVARWTDNNLMRLNEAKCHYMIYTRTHSDFTTRLTVNGQNLDQKEVSKLLGLWITEDLSWSRNCQEICKKAFSRLSMITKLKYAGVSIDDLLDIYILFIRSITEYCAVVFHSSLTQEQSRKIEMIQKTCLRVILAEMYVGYPAALEMCGLQTLCDRREKRCIDFAIKCLKNTKTKRIFPFNPITSDHYLRDKEVFHVNFAKTSTYKNSAIPYCQRLLNLKCNEAQK